MSDIERGIISAESSQQCDYCGAVAELRPYGKAGAVICFKCAMSPEHKAATMREFRRRLARFTALRDDGETTT